MKPAWIYLVTAAGLVGLIWLSWPGASATRDQSVSARVPPPPRLPETTSSPQESGDAHQVAPRSTLADELNAPAGEIHTDLKIVSTLIDTFRSNFPATGNPTGTNAEITASLLGRNRLRLSILPADHPALNAQGELCDRWGHCVRTHAESGIRMDVRSAGPDRKHWTADDMVLTQ